MTTLSNQKLFGMFELDTACTVLYSRAELDGQNGEGIAPDLTGRALFDDSAPFSNAGELRQRINNFRSSRAQAGSFDFTCDYPDGPITVRVLLARIRERNDYDRTQSILVHIRRRL